ncbi:MAG: hypothetical protein IPJ77_04920 [Planctomycetes bacterium]|nr:hypothetical protein [Planctomycetota bacterium]
MRPSLFALLALSSLPLPALHAQTTWFVDAGAVPPGIGTPTSPYASLQYAIDRPTTLDGDTVLAAPGTYVESLLITKSITVKSSQGPLVTTILATSGDDGVVLSGSLTATVLEGFTVTTTTQVSGVYGGPGTVRRCIVRDCTSLAGIECTTCRIESSTIIGNLEGIVGQPYGGTIELENSIAWGNAWGNVSPAGALFLPRYSAGFGSTSDGNVPGDPGLWDVASGNARLRPGSPCIDAGDPTSPLDPDGSRADIGAIPYDATYAPGPSVYCEGKLNSQGCVPSIGFSGSASASSATPFLVTATNVVPHRRGFLFYGFAKDAQPFQGGTYCVLQPTRRTRGQDSLGGPAPCTGAFSYDFNERIQSGADPFLVPGALVYAQYWYRDPADPSGFASGLSDALCFGVAP